MPDGNQAQIGHNVSAQRLKPYIERIERLMEERRALGKDINEVFSEAKSTGFDPKIMKKVIRLRGMDAAERAEEEALIGVYFDAVGC